MYLQDAVRLLVLNTVSLLHCFLRGHDFPFVTGIHSCIRYLFNSIPLLGQLQIIIVYIVIMKRGKGE